MVILYIFSLFLPYLLMFVGIFIENPILHNLCNGLSALVWIVCFMWIVAKEDTYKNKIDQLKRRIEKLEKGE